MNKEQARLNELSSKVIELGIPFINLGLSWNFLKHLGIGVFDCQLMKSLFPGQIASCGPPTCSLTQLVTSHPALELDFVSLLTGV